MDGDSTRVVIDLDPSVDPIGGGLRVGRGAVQPFAGWLELAGALADALAQARQAETARLAAAPPRQPS